ncbi:bifunctional oligoribonuclease/PAP phosphatase NrnA [Actinoallomurus spadix]|uniref:Bifunctional oligoribonuclease/PAP phosphatase NrnA n=1 Tax=Actinoallomurus spadix TaxID=79912 RepID=A0ABN0XHY3_9ACTN|nr:bifunctional oligoribonuclease/PAP phosphatase NrnA [Actinoallomurus spadix]MCO5987614.1 bifunctional oligoribonuclease/PAP phosphatase NrnA [Actinoallomurus spadix]
MNSAPGKVPAIAADEWARAVDAIQRTDEVCLACHVCPDGDALGSMLAFAQALRALGKPFTASFGDAFVVPRILRFLPGLDLLTDPADFPAEPDVMVTFDAAGGERLGTLAANAGKAGELIVVDHHASNTRFGTTHLVDPGAAATAVLVERFIDLLGVPLTHDIALDLYVGLVTDTGSFKYRSTTPEVHALAQRLLAMGVRPEQVAREVWDRAPFGYLPVLAAALGRARLERDVANGLGLVWTTVTRADRAAHDLPYDLLEGVIDVVRRTDEAEVAVVFKEDDEGAWQVSTRSKGRVDVGRACVALGGGGHPTAAGFTLHGDVEPAVARLRGLLTEIEVSTR